MELTREYILRLQKNRQGATGGGSGAAGTSGNYVTPAQLESALANKVDVSFFSRLFELYNGDGTTAAKIETNATLPEDTSKLNIKAPFDFWSQRSVSALGKGGSGSSSVFDEAAMWTALGGSIDNKQIALSHLTTALSGYVKGVKVGETTYNPNASGIVDLGTITGRTYAFATGATNGTFKVTPSVGDAYEVAIKGLAALAYKASLTAEDIPNLDATKITTGILGVDRIPGLAASKIVSGTLDAARIPSLSWNKITTDKPTTLAGYGITDAKIENGVITLGANTITPLTDAKLKSGYEWWGQKLDASGKINGIMTFSSNTLAMATNYTDVWNDGTNDHPWYGYDHRYANTGVYSTTISDYFGLTLRTGSGYICMQQNGYVGIGTNSPSTLLHVNGYTRTNRLYLQSASVYFELDSDGDVHLVGAGFYSDSFVSALGKGDSGSSSVFDEAAMWTALGGSIDNKQIALSHLTTALSGYVKGVKVGSTTYSPNGSGIVDLGTITGRTYAFATGATNGTFKVTPSVGDAYEVAIKGLAALAYKASLTAEDIPNLDATKITTGILSADRIPGLAASKIVSGTLDAARIPSLSWNKITTDKPTTLAGYGIADAKIENGVITLGANTITPLTDAKLKSGYEWWGQKLDASGKINGIMTFSSNTLAMATNYTDVWNDGTNDHPWYGYDHRYANTGVYSTTISDYFGLTLRTGSGYICMQQNGYVGIGTNSPSTLLHVNGYTRTNRLYLQSASVYFELDSDGDVHLVGAGFYSDSFVSALGKGDSGSAFVLNEPLQSINTTFSANPSASQAGYAIVWNGSRWTYGKAASDGVDMNTVWNALNGSTGGKQINTAWLTGVTKTLTITSGNTTVVYDGTVARSITINDMAAKQLTASTIDGTAGSFFFYGDNLINNQFDWVGIQVDKTSNNSPDRGQLVWDSGSISVRQNDGDSWTDWALVLTNKNCASQIAAGTITNAMLAGSIANSKLANSSVTINGSSVSLGGSITTSKWGESRNINIASSDGTGASTSVSVDGSKAVTLKLPSTIKASLTGNADTATKLNTGTATYSAWGQEYWSNGVPKSVSGLLSSVSGIKINSTGSGYGYIDFHYASTAGYTSNIYEPKSGQLAINSLLYVTKGGYVGVGTNSPSTLLHVNGYTRTNRLYLQSDSVYFELDSTGNVHLVGAGFYSDSFISALGKNDSGSGGGVTLNEPLASINSSSLGSPSGHTNSTLVYNGSSWVWSNSQGVSLGAFNFSAFAGNFNTLAINNKAVATQEWVTNNYMPMCGFVSANANTVGWGTLTPANGYSAAMIINAPGNSSGYFGYKDGQLSFQIDGLFYQNDGKYKVLDTNTAYISGQTITINGTSLTVPTGAGGDYLPLSGGTLTGILNLNFQSINASETNNGISQAHVYPTTFNICDKYGKILTRMEADVESTGDISAYWYVRNYNTSGGLIGQKGIRMRLTKGGVFSYTVDEPDKFREAIGVNLGNYVAKTGDTMTGTLNINYNSGSAYALNVTGGFNLVSTSNSGILNATELRLTAGYGIKMVGGANDVTVGDSSHANAVFAYGGFKKNGSSDSYVLLGGGGHKALSEIGGGLPTSYVTSYTAELSSYWVKAWDMTIKDRKYDDLNMTILVQSEYNNLRGIICIRIRQEGTNNSGSYNFGTRLTQMSGNIPNDRFRLYYNNSTGKCELWCNVAEQWGVFNFSVLKKCWRTSTDVATMGTFYNTNFSSVQTLPTRASGYAYTVMGSNDASNMKLTNIDAYASNNDVTSTQTATSICVYDKNNLDLSGIKTLVYANGAIATKWYVRNYTSAGAQETENAITMNMTKSGAVTYSVNNPDKFREAIGVNLANYLPLSGGKLTGDLSEVRPNGGYRLFAGYASGEAARFEALDGNGTWKAKGFTLLQNGNIGINKDNPQQRLDVNGNAAVSGNVGIGTTNPMVKLDVKGVVKATELQLSQGFYLDWNNTNANAYSIGDDGKDIYAEGDWYGRWVSSSDVRLKDINQYLDGKLEDIALAPIFSFRWKNKPNKPLELGTSAQYWKEHLPYSVTQAHSGYLALDYGATALAAAVFTARKVVDHELRIKQLQDRVIELENELKQLKAA